MNATTAATEAAKLERAIVKHWALTGRLVRVSTAREFWALTGIVVR